MKIIPASYEILDTLNGSDILKKIELCGRVCYKSEDRITDDSARKFVADIIIKRGHESVLEHFSFSVRFIVDRGVSHELVRHRIASFSQESTRYCNYGNDDDGCTFIRPCFWETEQIPNPDLFKSSEPERISKVAVFKATCGVVERALTKSHI